MHNHRAAISSTLHNFQTSAGIDQPVKILPVADFDDYSDESRSMQATEGEQISQLSFLLKIFVRLQVGENKRHAKRLSECIGGKAQPINVTDKAICVDFRCSLWNGIKDKKTNGRRFKAKGPKVKRKKGLSASLSGENSRKT
ncbi:hypothetical protein PoB_002348000 [Plakobranchus ocellatus]|uniref:Uncharacterized protein n=1 Tax=Plakobranchus ocellatus TaxID=259542 RepID=A0AAV3ZP96_9GAST|nr:hypothetical protein PoB_002348000 [Plakobranchus ocellatus]